jgi:hypothetical protein
LTSIETVQYDVTTILKKCREHLKTAKQGIIDVCHIFEDEGKTPKEKIGERVYEECRKLGYSEDEIDYVRKCVPSEFKDHSNDPKSEPLPTSTLENLNTINEKLTDDRFTELKNSTNDAVPLMAQYDLVDEQLNQLSEAEQREYFDKRETLVSRQDQAVKTAKTNLKERKEKKGIKSAEEELKESTIIPPENLWSKESLSYQIHDKLGSYYELLSKAHYDIRNQIEKFTPTAEIQKEHKEAFLHFRDKVIVPLANIDAYICNFHKTMMDNVTDEKYGDTFHNMLKNGEDKFWNAGNHGSGEINSILTGKFIGKLKTNQSEIDEALELGEKPPEPRYIVYETPMQREYTREQEGDETRFDFHETRSLKCYNCKKENFYKMVPVEVSDSMLGDWIHKARMATIGNGLSAQLETICDHVTIRKLRSPVDILKYYKKNATEQEIENLGYIFGQPEKMKEVEIDSKAVMSMGYNIIYGRAGRRANKAEHFSNVA